MPNCDLCSKKTNRNYIKSTLNNLRNFVNTLGNQYDNKHIEGALEELNYLEQIKLNCCKECSYQSRSMLQSKINADEQIKNIPKDEQEYKVASECDGIMKMYIESQNNFLEAFKTKDRSKIKETKRQWDALRTHLNFRENILRACGKCLSASGQLNRKGEFERLIGKSMTKFAANIKRYGIENCKKNNENKLKKIANELKEPADNFEDDFIVGSIGKKPGNLIWDYYYDDPQLRREVNPITESILD